MMLGPLSNQVKSTDIWEEEEEDKEQEEDVGEGRGEGEGKEGGRGRALWLVLNQFPYLRFYPEDLKPLTQ